MSTCKVASEEDREEGHIVFCNGQIATVHICMYIIHRASRLLLSGWFTRQLQVSTGCVAVYGYVCKIMYLLLSRIRLNFYTTDQVARILEKKHRKQQTPRQLNLSSFHHLPPAFPCSDNAGTGPITLYTLQPLAFD